MFSQPRIPVIGTQKVIGNPTLTKLDESGVSTLATLTAKSVSDAERAEYGLYLVDTTAPEGKIWTGAFETVNGQPEPVFVNPPVVDVATKRQKASLTRREFCLGLAERGILTGPDAIAAAKGEWPAAMADFLGYLDEAQALDAQIEWAATAQIDRLHPFVLSMASWLSMSDADVDALFGIA